jgi:D-beta-D-heptose 7-phosphate kinase/D-beta-D-heptose 1-phosphate adenosyltransferase
MPLPSRSGARPEMAGPSNDLIQRLAGRAVLVIGDLMVDHFLVGSVERISPEAPVPVVRFQTEEFRLGGACNVANNVSAMAGRAVVIGVVGDDQEGRRLCRDLTSRAIGVEGIVTDAGRCTTRKVRVVTTRNQQVARIDYESDQEVAHDVESTITERLARLIPDADVVVISDYLKGAISRTVASASIQAASAAKTPVLIDPKVPHIDYYRGATLITPNHHEAEAVAHMRIRTDADAREAAQRFRERAGCENVLITRGEHGMYLHTPDGDTTLPAEAREVADVTGAGDTVIGTIALALAAGGSLLDAARLANRAAGIVVGKFGPATVSVEACAR